MQFAHPNLLWLLLVIPAAMIAFYVWSARKRRALIVTFIQARLLPSLLSGDSDTRRNIRFGLLVAAVCLVIVALARPQWGFTWEEVKQRGLDIVVAVDISKSMLAEDIQPNRLARAKLAAMDLLRQARSDRLGLVAFAGSAFLQCPLTIDDAVFRQSLDGLDVNTISRGGTALSDAIEAAMGAFGDSENYKVLVLLTDGEDHDSGAMETARQAAAKGLEIFTIGVGTTEGELLRVKDASGKMDYVRDENGNVVKSRLNERILQELAGNSSRGFYLPLRGAKVIDTLYTKGLAPMPKSEAGEKLVKRFHEQFQWPLGLAILLLSLEMLYPERRRGPKIAGGQARIPAARAPLVYALLAAACPFASLASPGSALRDYRAGDYEKSLQEYKQLLERKPEDPRLHLNAGAAAYKDGQFTEAASHFDQATIAQDLNLQQQAYYNRGNALFQMGETLSDTEKKNEVWNKSLQDYETALKLNSKDTDAAHNLEYVKRRLEELKQQQEQEKQKKDQKDEQEKDQQEQQDKQDKGEQSQQQQKQEQDSQSKDKQEDPSQSKEEPEEKPQQKPESGQEEPPEKAGQQEPREEPEEGEPHPPGQMSPTQARQLLDAEKGDEKVLQLKPKETESKGRPLKDW